MCDVCCQVKRKEETYINQKYALDQKVAADKRGLEDEERRLESLGAVEDLDRLTAESNASVDVLRVQIKVPQGPTDESASCGLFFSLCRPTVIKYKE